MTERRQVMQGWQEAWALAQLHGAGESRVILAGASKADAAPSARPRLDSVTLAHNARINYSWDDRAPSPP